MLTIIHGDDIAGSRRYYTTAQRSVPDPVSLQGDTVSITDIAQILTGGSLFQEQKNIFIEELITKKRSADELKVIASSLSLHANSHTITLWEGKELSKTQLNLFKLAESKVFKLPQTLFLFLDALRPKNGEHVLKLFHQTLQTSEPEMIFFMLVRQFRILLALSEQEARIDETKRMAPWQKTKLKKQARLFSPTQLKQIFMRLSEIDLGMKTGVLSLPLVPTIDMLLLSM